MEERDITISPSQMGAMDCRLNWYWGYKSGYRPMRSSTALELGIGIHEALDQYYGHGEDPVRVFDEWSTNRIAQLEAVWEDDVDDLRKNRELGMAMLEGYVEHYKDIDDFDVLATEKTLRSRIPIPGTDELSDYWLVARLDGLVRDRSSGKLFSLEHKTFSRFDPSQMELDHQFTAQVWLGQQMAKELGLDDAVAGVIYNGLRKQAPGPRVKLPLFERHILYRTQKQIEVMLYRAYNQAKEFNSPDLAVYPQPSHIRCSYCDFRAPCTEYQRGGDFQFILDQQFSVRGEG